VVPGRVAPWNGQIHLVEAARTLVGTTRHPVTFVLVGDDRRHSRYARSLAKAAQEAGVDSLFRTAGHVVDMPAAYAASDIVVVPYVAPPPYGRVVAEAQAMARPVIASAIGPLPENLLAPPRMPDALRTGWLVQPANPSELAHAIDAALSLDAPAYRALAGRAKQYGEFMFAPQRIAAATLGVYVSVLEQ
jgi:glycosyltransferase involved in cell wall biosynthesis